MDEHTARAAGLGRVAWGTERGNAKNLLCRLYKHGAITREVLVRCLRLLPQVTPDPHRWCIFGADMLANPKDVLADLEESVPKYHERAVERAPAPPPKPKGHP